MRDIKFRAWSKEKKEMIYFGIYDTDEGYLIQKQIFLDCLPIMQYTGLHDRRGKDIYFGDIVTSPITGNHKMVVNEVWVAHKIIDIDKCNDTISGVLIIGNIYESPEVLHE